MAEFDDVRRSLRDTREAAARLDGEWLALRERLKRLAAREAELARRSGANDDDPRRRQERERLARERALAQQEQERLRGARREMAATEAGLQATFARFTDPRIGIERFDDRTPILMMPLRLETRFKEVSLPGVAGPVPELWVRVYPDDCWIDTFDPLPTAAEIQNTRTYWINVWQAGGIEDQERAAWRALVGSHGSGRASWLVEQHAPANLAEKPSKPRAQDLILTIAADADAASPLTPAETAAAATFWRAAWLADGGAAAVGAARGALEAAAGLARADEIVTQYAPANFAARPPDGLQRSDLNVAVAFVVFPAAGAETKESAWARAPKMTLLPDRFLFLGYRGGELRAAALGHPVPATLFVGPDPSAEAADQLQQGPDGDLLIPDQLRWLSDFERAEKDGMGLRVPLDAEGAARGFDRVLVVGLRVNADAQAAQVELETLLRHHAYGRTGLSLVPQGTPTNNTDAAASGHGRQDDADQSFDDRKAPLFTPSTDWLDKKDGQWLAEFLGVSPAVFEHTHHADMTDQLAGRAMNEALWPATLGYWMETMMAPVFTPGAVEQARRFFNRYVLAAGAVPALRIGDQPYGILPATALSRARWLDQAVPGRGAEGDLDLLPFLRRLHPILMGIDRDWRFSIPSDSLAHVGRDAGPTADPHRTLLEIVGLHPGSVEWSQRWAESLQSMFNRLNLQGFGGALASVLLALQRQLARQTLTNFGYTGTATPPLLEMVFSGDHLLLKGGVVDDTRLSESLPLRAATTAGKNYLQWLLDAAHTSLDALYQQTGFVGDTPPLALLFLMLRHALQLGYHDVSIKMHEGAGLYTPAQSQAARREATFIHVSQAAVASESRYQALYTVQPAITGSATQSVQSYIATQLGPLFEFPLRDQLSALERLKGLPTARLERAFADHVDCCSYRLDAWLQGLVAYQLAQMRNLAGGQDAQPRTGIHLGGYAWLEDLRPDQKVLTPVALQDPALVAEFARPGEPPLVRDSTNQGFIHAPSLNQAVTAAVLRNGFISNASEKNRQTMAVNLTSERVRTALALLEGIRGGQGLADLLGYQFERGLHDRHALAEVDKFIYKMRRAFPLRAGKLASTKPPEGVSIESIEARNVIDGLAFVEHLKATKNTTYPFGKTGLPHAEPNEALAIETEAKRLLEAHDAVADLALSEGVYQAVLGNYDRVASTYDAYARGHFPPEPDVIRTPLSGLGITARVALHLEAGALPTVSPIAGLAMTPRAQGEPAVNAWLASSLPPLGQIACVVSFRDAAAGGPAEREVTLEQLGLQPADLVAIIGDDSGPAMTELDDRIARLAHAAFGPRPDVTVSIAYMKKMAARFSVFEVLPLLRSLRRLATLSRPLTSTDLALTGEARSSHDQAPFVDKQRLVLVRTALLALRTDLATFKAVLEGPLSDLPNRAGEILKDADDYVSKLALLLARAATFAIPQTGWGFAYDFQRRVFEGLLAQAAALATRWDGLVAEFDALIGVHDALPLTASDEEHFRVLSQAERALSTVPTAPLPATPALFRTALLTVTRPAFLAKRQQFADVAASTRTGVAALRTDLTALLPIDAFDVTPFTLAAPDDETVHFAQDALQVVNAILGNVDRRLQESADRFKEADEAALAGAVVAALEQAAAALLGDGFRVVPEFTLEDARADEFANAVAISTTPAPFLHLTHPPDPDRALDFPLDTWLHGVARVREKMQAWEQVVLMTGALGETEPALQALQLPVIPGDAWVGLELAPGQKLDSERLLYTAHFAAPFNKAARQCGLLLDEWNETVPGPTADTGIVFHDDRPNNEAPQAMLLVTPSEFRGAWQWNDLVDALNETLELAKRRALEPAHLEGGPYAPLLPATVVASQARQLTIAANLALNNRIVLPSQER